MSTLAGNEERGQTLDVPVVNTAPSSPGGHDDRPHHLLSTGLRCVTESRVTVAVLPPHIRLSSQQQLHRLSAALLRSSHEGSLSYAIAGIHVSALSQQSANDSQLALGLRPAAGQDQGSVSLGGGRVGVSPGSEQPVHHLRLVLGDSLQELRVEVEVAGDGRLGVVLLPPVCVWLRSGRRIVRRERGNSHPVKGGREGGSEEREGGRGEEREGGGEGGQEGRNEGG